MPAILRAYVDETGDRGSSGASSSFFAFACVLIPDEDEGAMRAAMSQLRRDLGVPVGRPLHWKEHVKVFSRRQHVTRVLTQVPGITLVYVLVEKSAIPASALMRANQEVFYNYAAGIVLERVLLAAGTWAGGPRNAVIRFGHVRGFDHSKTLSYFALRQRRQDPPWVPWNRLQGRVHFDGQGNWDGLQAADQYAGMLSAAIRQDQFGNYEPQHFLKATPQLRRVNGRTWGYGFKLLGNAGTLHALPWWGMAGI